MMKQLSILLGAVMFMAACKPDAPASSSGSSAEPASGHARSAKIDVKPIDRTPPALPAAGSAQAAAPPERGMRPNMDPAEREEMRKRRLERFDKDGDGQISAAERAAAMKERMDTMHARLDTDGDGKLSPAELAASRGGRFKMLGDPSALDTNHDGDISADELSAGMQARRDERRAMRDANAGSNAPQPTMSTTQPTTTTTPGANAQ